jgi:membrane glycosyltransferase
MPIFNVDTHRTFAGLHAMYQEIVTMGTEQTFELFILSDTKDPNLQLQEKILWDKMCTHFNAQDRIFYRHREQNIGRKSGNIADFCQNWGGRYDYMVILDSDSLMSAELLLNLNNTIRAHPEVGILQTTMVPVNAQSLFGRMMQFAACIQGKFFAAGTAFWQLSQAPYWGHNAIIRMSAFVAHARLPKLPGNPPLGGEILSHDLIEATLLRETNWDVWFLYDTPGSFEELPPDILDYAKRDRRWCQGNLQHTRFLFTKNLSHISRIYFYLGTLMYLASPLWLCYFFVTTIVIYHWNLSVLAFGQIPIFILLFFPRTLSLVSILFEKKQVALFGGYLALITSAFLELILSILLAPIWMLYHTKFIAAIILGYDIGWPSKNPSMDGLGLKEAISAHGWLTLTGFFILLILYTYVPQSLVWFLPLLLGPLLSIPLAMLLSSTKWGARAKKYKLFYTPEESNPSELVRIFEREMLKP